MRHSRRCIVLAALLLAAPLADAREGGGEVPGPAAADSGEGAPGQTLSEQEDRRLWMGGRELLHAGIPVELIGREEGDNDFRAGAPALERSDRLVARVDREELRRRRLALYAGETVFTRPPALRGKADATRGTLERGTRRAPARPTGAEGEPESGSGWTSVLVLSAFVLAAAGVVWRGLRPGAR